MTKVYNPPMLQNVGPLVDPKEMKKLRRALFGPQLVHDAVLTTGSYKELEKRLASLLKDDDEVV